MHVLSESSISTDVHYITYVVFRLTQYYEILTVIYVYESETDALFVLKNFSSFPFLSITVVKMW